MPKSIKIYLISALDLEPYDHYNWPERAFYSRQEAEEFLKSHPDKYDYDTENFRYGWAYSTHIQEITLEGENNG